MSFQEEIDNDIKAKRLYFIGDQLPPDWYAAFKTWMAAAQNGDSKAQYNVGRCYSRGDGIDRDLEQAHAWYMKAAEQGDPRAHFNLHLLYENKDFSQHDAVVAKKYLDQSIALNEPRAKSARLSNYIKARNTLLVEISDTLYFRRGDIAEPKNSIAKATKSIAKVKELIANADPELTSGWSDQVLAALELTFTPHIRREPEGDLKFGNALYRGTYEIKNNSALSIVAAHNFHHSPRLRDDIIGELSIGAFRHQKNCMITVMAESIFDAEVRPKAQYDLKEVKLPGGNTGSLDVSEKYTGDYENERKRFQLIVEDKKVALLSENTARDFFDLYPPLDPPLILEKYQKEDYYATIKPTWAGRAQVCALWAFPLNFFSYVRLVRAVFRSGKLNPTNVFKLYLIFQLFPFPLLIGLLIAFPGSLVPGMDMLSGIISMTLGSLVSGYLFFRFIVKPLAYSILGEESTFVTRHALSLGIHTKKK